MQLNTKPLLVAFAAIALVGAGSPETAASLHPLLFAVVAILLGAKIFGDLAVRFGQPEVLGELVAGVILGNLSLAGFDGLHILRTDPIIHGLSELGVILLLFRVGLHTSVKEMLAVGASSFCVAVCGVIVPFFLGWGVGILFHPEESIYMHIFLGATLTATSVGITARVLEDLGKAKTKEAKIILGAAVIDDVLGLLVLAAVSGSIVAANAGGEVDGWALAMTCAKAVGFLAAAVAAGPFLAEFLRIYMRRLQSSGTVIAFGLVICFSFAALAALAGLAPIVGAFAAGLILEPAEAEEERKPAPIDLETLTDLGEILSPLTHFLVPIFFVVMGAGVDLSVFTSLSILGFAGVLTAAAVAGKLICGIGVLDRTTDRIAIGIGMVPRGEVGLIFAGIGSKLMLDGELVVNAEAYAAVVIMVIFTTMITPPVVSWWFSRLD